LLGTLSAKDGVNVVRTLSARDDRNRPGALRWLARLGPGLITGAADDDPSGIATYSQAGAAYGFGLLWTALFSLPLMIAVQLMCARIGLVARRGLGSVLREFYPPWVLWLACGLVVVANTVNLGADLAGMGAAAALLTGAPASLFVPLFAVLVLALLVLASYARLIRIFKWMTLTLLAYVVTAFVVHPDWGRLLRETFLPHVALDRDAMLTIVAILGTTISPYLFFWQAAQEAEEGSHHAGRSLGRMLGLAATDTRAGMLVSNFIMYFVILTTGATLHASGHSQIETAAQAAAALQPLAGGAAGLLFALGVIGTGLIGVPVLAGSAAYAVAEASRWRRGMDEKPRTAPRFYAVIAVATILGAAFDIAHMNAIRMLIWAAVINGVLAPPLIVVIVVIGNDRRVMGSYTNGWALNVGGVVAALVMTTAAVALVWFSISAIHI
jgi:NRAMP (natural resistance-associated macrophage protein)-like metal ion transporter